ncbi:hypothetical protein N665_0487s0002, partial [Sinapis alba]
LVTTCFWFLLVSSFAGANEANVNCLRSLKSGVTEDANQYLSRWESFKFPVGIKLCSDLVRLDLSRNNFSGVLPSNIGSLVVPLLTTLDLSENQFSVSRRRLTKFSVAFNQLTGHVPNFNLKFGRESFSSNEGLCGHPMDPCVDPEEDVIRLEKIGAAIGAVLFAPLGVFLDWFVFSGRKKKQEYRRH